jgi:hypothetical protein
MLCFRMYIQEDKRLKREGGDFHYLQFWKIFLQVVLNLMSIYFKVVSHKNSFHRNLIQENTFIWLILLFFVKFQVCVQVNAEAD